MEPWTTARRSICEATSAVGAGAGATKGITPGRTSLRREGSAAFDKMRLLTAGVRVFGAGARPAPLPEDSARLDDPLAPRPPATAGRTGAGLAGLGTKSPQSPSSSMDTDVRRGELSDEAEAELEPELEPEPKPELDRPRFRGACKGPA